MFYAFVPDYLLKVSEVGSFQDLAEWFMDLPTMWQWILGCGGAGIIVGLFILVYGIIFK